jgi:hypothetical protein
MTRIEDYGKDRKRDRRSGNDRESRGSGRDPTPDRRSHSKERVDDHKKRTEDARDKKGGQDPKGRHCEFSPHPARDRSNNCEYTQVDRADDQLLSASIPHPSCNPRIPSLHVDVLPGIGAWSAD